MPQALLIALMSLAVPAPALGEILFSSVRVARLPEPGSLILLGTGLIAVAFWLGWSRRRHARRHGASDQGR
jgi:PEP-CTERM motif